jgi:pimeloyl-ACP methyl ester carboxylesterase
MADVKIRDIRMHYQVYGRFDGEPLVLLHAFTATGAMYDPLLDVLGERYRLYVPDLRGHGRTTNPQGEIRHEELARDAAAFAAALGLDRAHFCGLSSGGMLLTFLALEQPQLVHSLTYAAATYTFDERVKTLARKFAGAASDDWIASLDAQHGAVHGASYARTMIELWAEAVQRPGELPFSPGDLSGIQCPALVIHGDRDVFFPVEVPLAMYQALPNAELCILPRCGHTVSFDRPEMFTTALLQFLARNPIDV